MILDKIIYLEQYDKIDQNMSDLNAGARKDRNCRNHTFIVNGILHEKKMEKGHPIDIQIFDVAKYFDEVWPADTINVLYELGVRNNNLCLLYEGTKKSFISIKIPSGPTERFEVEQLIAQGSTWGPLMTSGSVDTIGKEAQESGKNTYIYKETVKVPPLSFVDDILAVNECGVDSITSNAVINAQIQCKKLRFGESKCHQMHVGKENPSCPSLTVNSQNEKLSMKKVKEDTYLGTMISDSCDNNKKMEKTINKGIGITSTIMAMLKEISFGHHYLDIATTLRDSIFVNGFLWNLETWYDIKEQDLKQLEKIDKMLLKRILNVPVSTPSALLYLELGLVPLRYIIQARRLTFLRYILTRNEDDLLLKFFKAQCREPSKNDWCSTIQNDLKEFGLDDNFDEIMNLSKDMWKNKVKEAMKIKAFDDLLDTQASYSKGKSLFYGELKMRK